MHRLYLLLTLGRCILKRLVLVLNALDLALDLFLPVTAQRLLPPCVVVLVGADLCQFSLLFDFQKRLLGGLCQQHVENRLNLTVKIKQVVVLNLSWLIEASFLGNVLGFGWQVLELVSLALDVYLDWSRFVLIGQEVGQVHINSCWGPDLEVIGRGLMLLLLVLQELGFNHLNLLGLLLLTDALLVFLSGRHVSERVHVVGVAAEDAFVVHNVESFTLVRVRLIIEAYRVRVGWLLLVLGFAAEYLWLCAFESLV